MRYDTERNVQTAIRDLGAWKGKFHPVDLVIGESKAKVRVLATGAALPSNPTGGVLLRVWSSSCGFQFQFNDIIVHFH